MKIVTLIARILLGVAFVFFGLNGILQFLKGPLPAGLAGQFAGALMESHYFILLGVLEAASGVLLLVNRYVPLALTVLGPIVVNILLFHVFMSPTTIAPGLVVTLLWFIVFYRHRSAFAGIFQAKT